MGSAVVSGGVVMVVCHGPYQTYYTALVKIEHSCCICRDFN